MDGFWKKFLEKHGKFNNNTNGYHTIPCIVVDESNRPCGDQTNNASPASIEMVCWKEDFKDEDGTSSVLNEKEEGETAYEYYHEDYATQENDFSDVSTSEKLAEVKEGIVPLVKEEDKTGILPLVGNEKSFKCAICSSGIHLLLY